MPTSRTSEPLLPLHGGYRKLKSFQVAQLVYDITVRFCELYLDRRSRTVDQMTQAEVFKREGGFTERLYRVRSEKRKNEFKMHGVGDRSMPLQQVIIVSAQPIPNLIPIITARTEKAHLLVSEKMIRQASRLRAFLNARGCATEEHAIDPYDMAQVEAACNLILEKAPPGTVSLNATGGTKIAAFGAFAAFRQRRAPVFYFDPEKWRIISLDSGNALPSEPVAELSVAEYLAVHGMNVIESGGEDDTFCQRLELTRWLAEHLPSSGLMPVLNAFAAEAQEKRSFPFAKSFEKRFDQRFTPLLKKLAAENIILWDAKTRTLTFPERESARYLGGFWLEEQVFDVVSSLGVHDVRRNVKVAWDQSGVKNEFDVVFTNRCRLFLVSCKTAKLGQERQYRDKNPVYELDSLKDSAAGLFGEGILVSASPLSDELKKRADTLRLISISAEDIRWLALKLKIAVK